MPNEKQGSEDHFEPLPHAVLMIFGIAHSQFMEAVAGQVSTEDLERIRKLSFQVLEHWTQIHKSESAEPHERLPSTSFLRHCGTPIADRYGEDIGVAIKEVFGAEAYERLRSVESMRMLLL